MIRLMIQYILKFLLYVITLYKNSAMDPKQLNTERKREKLHKPPGM